MVAELPKIPYPRRSNSTILFIYLFIILFIYLFIYTIFIEGDKISFESQSTLWPSVK